MSLLFFMLFSFLLVVVTGVFLRDRPKKVSSSVLRRRLLRDWRRRSTKMRLQCGESGSFGGRRHRREMPRLLFLFVPAVTSVSASPGVRSVLAASVSESDQHKKTISRSSSLQPPLDPSFSFSSAGKTNEKRRKLTRRVVRGAGRPEAEREGRRDEEPLKASWRGDGEEVLVEMPVIGGLSGGGEGDGKTETAKLWKCNECGGLFETSRGLHIHVGLKHRRWDTRLPKDSAGTGTKAMTLKRHRSVKRRWRGWLAFAFTYDRFLSAHCAALRCELGTTASMGETALSAKSVRAAPFVSMGEDALSARSVVAAPFVSMGENAITAKSVVAAPFVSMGDDALSAKTAGDAPFVSMGEYARRAKSVVAAPFVSMGENAITAKSVVAAPFVSMGEDALSARSVGAAPFVSMGECALSARSVGAAPFVSMGDDALSAKTAGDAPFVSMGENALSAKSVGAAPFVSMGEYARRAKSVGAAPFVSMREYARRARSVGAAPFVSMGEYALGARSADCERLQLQVVSPDRREHSLCDAKERVQLHACKQ
uniref:C2H2-type domain-containing protein n=1 Tax=Chromera velia CCMP2878 TaxID=1169474 RepID=A0A0G4H0C3_9ALVE|eukprot:Cvel_24188.t1-p1 / transcript=Cvel_24188.t1 / gene=Cvel_24188 / organism=Chromera_velia_CCMP2878 / gene_product=Zinc finger protein 283, putative / transcript_product=Zinc finger protein 283, putative / location=Cvel_scaffold2583:6981-9189(-) / protein_length=539 / sequence_SO=supercontig / SO=protein_coding / is_pseudo=false